jgi:hypothetical protein
LPSPPRNAPDQFPRTALRWHGRLCREVDLGLEEAQAVLAALVLLAGERKTNAAFALAELLSRRGLERPCERLVAWPREPTRETPAHGVASLCECRPAGL